MDDKGFNGINNIPNNEGDKKGYDENNKDFKESKKENSQGFEEKKEDFGQKEEFTEQEKVNYYQKREDGQRYNDGDSINNDRETFSANYEPPYYVPNFTVYGSDDGSVDSAPPKKEKRYGIGVIVAVCVISILISAAVGAFAGFIAGGGNIAVGSDGQKQTVNIIRSDREINVEEIMGSTGYTNLTVAQVAASVGESVVEITTAQVQTNPFYEQYVTSGAGSGVIFDQKDQYGYIVTNYHVIEGADKIIVRVKDGETYTDYEATYMAGDAAEDIAVIRITVDPAVTLSCAIFVNDSDNLVVGEQVVAIGNPLGQLGGTVTDGIISALDREIAIGDNVMTLLQTNVAINPGNSGGGLFNMAGELVGIVNAKQSSTGIEGLGFAIPANRVAKDINDILEYGYIKDRITLGATVEYIQNTGVTVVENGQSGFSKNDVILKIGNIEISDMGDYNEALKALALNQSVVVRVARLESNYFGVQRYVYTDVTVVASENQSIY